MPPAETDPEKVREVLNDVDTECMVLLSDDPALGLTNAKLTALAPCPVGGGRPLPVIMFEPRIMARQELPDGSARELQVEGIIQHGFHRWMLPFAQLETLPDWSLRQTGAGAELWDHGGIWARGVTSLDGAWFDAAAHWGVVLVIYGFATGARTPGTGRPSAAERAAKLRDARSKGLIATALIPWRPLPVPDVVNYPGPTYNPVTGQFEIGMSVTGTNQHWRLHTPGQTLHHGLIMGGPGIGKTNALRIILLEALCSGRYVVWSADPTGHADFSWVSVHEENRTATSPAQTVHMLETATRVIEARLASGTDYRTPTPETPGLLIGIDECQHVFAGNPAATQLAEHIVTAGGPAGVSLVATARGADLAYFGGSSTLRSGLAKDNCAGFGPNGYDLMAQAREHQEASE